METTPGKKNTFEAKPMTPEEADQVIARYEKIIPKTKIAEVLCTHAFDVKLRALETALNNPALRKDERDALERDFNNIEAKKKDLFANKPQPSSAAIESTPTVAPEVVIDVQKPENSPTATAAAVQQPPIATTLGIPRSSSGLPPQESIPTEGRPFGAPSFADDSRMHPRAERIMPTPFGETRSAANPSHETVGERTPTAESIASSEITPATVSSIPEASPEQPLSLEAARYRYGNAIYEARAKIKAAGKKRELVKFAEYESPVLTEAERAALIDLKKTYEKHLHDQVAAIMNDPSKTALARHVEAAKFIKSENEALGREVMERENEETKKRIKQAMSKAGEYAKKGIKGVGSAAGSIFTFGMLLGTATVMAGIDASRKPTFAEKIISPDKKPEVAAYDMLRAKFANKDNTALKVADSVRAKKEAEMQAADAKRSAEAKKEEAEQKKQSIYREKIRLVAAAFGEEKLEGQHRNMWKNLKDIQAYTFVNPNEKDADWGKDEKTSQPNPPIALENYPTHARSIRDVVKQYIDREKISEAELKTTTLDALLDRVVEAEMGKQAAA